MADGKRQVDIWKTYITIYIMEFIFKESSILNFIKSDNCLMELTLIKIGKSTETVRLCKHVRPNMVGLEASKF